MKLQYSYDWPLLCLFGLDKMKGRTVMKQTVMKQTVMKQTVMKGLVRWPHHNSNTWHTSILWMSSVERQDNCSTVCHDCSLSYYNTVVFVLL